MPLDAPEDRLLLSPELGMEPEDSPLDMPLDWPLLWPLDMPLDCPDDWPDEPLPDDPLEEPSVEVSPLDASDEASVELLPDSLGTDSEGVSLPLVGVLLVNPSVVTNVSVGVPLGPVV